MMMMQKMQKTQMMVKKDFGEDGDGEQEDGISYREFILRFLNLSL